jgi:hypothetical protein
MPGLVCAWKFLRARWAQCGATLLVRGCCGGRAGVLAGRTACRTSGGVVGGAAAIPELPSLQQVRVVRPAPGPARP